MFSNFRTAVPGILAVVLLSIQFGAAFGDTPAISGWTPHSSEPQVNSASLGWQFTVNKQIAVTQLGFWDLGQNGLNDAHSVAIWNSAQSILVQASIPGGTTASLAGEFRYVPVTNTILSPGQTYYIASFFLGSANEPRSTDNGTVTTSPDINYQNGRFVASSSLAFPTTDVPAAGALYFGPTFQYSVVPEPSCIALRWQRL